MRRKQALTLAELIVAFGILTVAVLSLIGVYVYIFRLQGRGTDKAQGAQVAHEFVERVKARGYDKITVGNYDGRPAGFTPVDVATGFPPGPYPKVNLYGQDFALVVTASPFLPRSRRVDVTVYWTSGRMLTLATVIHK